MILAYNICLLYRFIMLIALVAFIGYLLACLVCCNSAIE